MIITRTPYRASFFGGGTDYPAWYREHGGAVLATTLDRYCYLGVSRMPPFLGSKYAVLWSRGFERADTVAGIAHPGVRGCLTYMGNGDPIEVRHMGDMPARSGLGSSSAFTCSMLLALHALRHRIPPAAELAKGAIAVEQDVLRETVGVQDQIICAHGGFNHVTIDPDGRYRLEPVGLAAETLRQMESRTLLFFTGIQRHASEIAASYQKAEGRGSLEGIAALVPKAMAALRAQDIDEFGRLLHESWLLKRGLSDRVSTPEIDDIYAKAREAGALGGKVLGAGGGGFMLFLATSGRQDAIRAALSPFVEAPFGFGHDGSRVVLQDGA